MLELPADELHAAFDRLTAAPFWVRDFDGSLRAMAALKRLTSELIARLCRRDPRGDAGALRRPTDHAVRR